MMVVSVASGPTFSPGKPTPLFEARFRMDPTGNFRNYDVSLDGQRFVMIESAQDLAPAELLVVLNWFEELKRLVPTDN